MAKKAINWAIIALIVFLPLSAWLVSLTGLYWVSLIRDILLFALIIAFVFHKKDWRLGALNIAIILFLLWLALSYFWREEGLSQWLRGVRYLGEPMVLLLIVGNLDLAHIDREKIARLFLMIALIVTLIGYLEYFYPDLIRASLSSALMRGRFIDYHAIGGEGYRIQSLLAGPNALGLYLMVAISTFWCWQGKIKKKWFYLIILLLAGALILTASRASWFGLGVALVIGIYLKKDLISQESRLFAVRAIIVLAIMAVMVFLILPENWKFHGASTQLRLEQYQRIWQEKSEIGLFGRGPGAAGLVSQYRFDEGPNYYSENTYLDMFEALGLIGALIYLTIWWLFLSALFKQKDLFGGGAFLGSLALFAAGLFLTHFTGQAALWMVLILGALAFRTKTLPPWLLKADKSVL